MALFCIIAEIEVLVENHDFLIPLAFIAPCPNIAIMFGKKKNSRMVRLRDSEKKVKNMYNRFDRILACERQTDRQKSCDGIVRAMHSITR